MSVTRAAGSVELRYGIAVRRADDTAVVTPSGELDLETSPRLAACLDDLLAEHVRDITVDLSKVTFLDTSALRALLRADAAVARRGGGVRLVAPNTVVRRMLGVTRCGHLLAA